VEKREFVGSGEDILYSGALQIYKHVFRVENVEKGKKKQKKVLYKSYFYGEPLLLIGESYKVYGIRVEKRESEKGIDVPKRYMVLTPCINSPILLE